MNAIDLLGFVNRIKNKQTSYSEIVRTLQHHLTHNSGRRTIAAEGITTQDKARRILSEFKVFQEQFTGKYSNDYWLELLAELERKNISNVYQSPSHTIPVHDADEWRNLGRHITITSKADDDHLRQRFDEVSKSIANKLAEVANKSRVATNGGIGALEVSQALTDLVTPSKQAAEALNDLGISYNKTQEPVTIEGVNADQYINVDRIWQRVLEHQIEADAKHEAKQHQTITINDGKPFAIAYLSDFHVGSSGVNYKALKKDVDTINQTEGFWSEFHGDAVDNWVVGKLAGLQRNQLLNFDEEWGLFLAILEMMQPKLLWVVSGNHDNWSFKIGGADRIRQALQGSKILYDTDEVNVTVKLGNASWRHKIRHKTRYNSVFNKSHGIERDLERGGDDFDIGVAGHTHVGTFFREFAFHGKMRLAILTGAYKRHDAFQREIGFAPTTHDGCGAVVYMPDGSLLPVQNIQLAAKVLTSLRAEA